MTPVIDRFPCCSFPDYAARKRYEVRTLVARRTAPDEKGYTWTMGYNNIVGRYTDNMKYGRFSGSSYNRSLRENDYAKDLCTITNDLLAMAAKVARSMSIFLEWTSSREIDDIFSRPDLASARRYTVWLRSKIPGDVVGLSFGIHVLSARSRGKIKDKATAFYRACGGKRTFVTLTFVSTVGDQAGVSILNKFLTSVRKECGGFQYIWVAERQPESGRIHFHLIINKRLPVKRFNALWVLQQYNAGLRTKNKYGEDITMEEVLQRYQDGTMQKILNPFDAKKISSIAAVSSYLTKYITKQEKDVPFACSVWHCSRGVSRLFTRATVSPSAFAYCRSFHNGKVDRETGEIYEVEVIRGDFYVMAYINNKRLPLTFLAELEAANKMILAGFQLDRLPMCDDMDYRKYFLSQN
jgi:hypothetical protein